MAGGARGGGAAVFAKRWVAVLAAAALLVLVIVLALGGGGPTLYWHGQHFVGGDAALSQGEQAMKQVVADDEGATTAGSRCYFSLPLRGSHDVSAFLRCGPVLLPWSLQDRPWLTLSLSAAATRGGPPRLSVQTSPLPSETVALDKGEVLVRPGGGGAPQGSGGTRVPDVPRQPSGWTGTLAAPPVSLTPAPAGSLAVAWAQSYRLLAYGQARWLPAHLSRSGLRAAVIPPDSAYSVPGRASGSGPRATLLLAPRGDVFVMAELAIGAGESAGAVPVQAGAGEVAADRPLVQVVAGGRTSTVETGGGPASPGAAPVTTTVVAVVPAGSRPELVVTDKGLAQSFSLTNGQLGRGPGVLARPGTDDPVRATGRLGGTEVHVLDASLVWFAGSDGGTVPPRYDQAYLQVLATTTPASASLDMSASDFSLELPGGRVLGAQGLPVYNRRDVVVGFVVPASFSTGTVVVSSGRGSFRVPVHFD